MASYFASLNFEALLRACPGGIAQGLIWGIMALGVYFTFRILDLADLSVDGSFATGGAVSIMLILNGWNPELTLIIAFIAGRNPHSDSSVFDQPEYNGKGESGDQCGADLTQDHFECRSDLENYPDHVHRSYHPDGSSVQIPRYRDRMRVPCHRKQRRDEPLTRNQYGSHEAARPCALQWTCCHVGRPSRAVSGIR